jgi:hypothetical protein
MLSIKQQIYASVYVRVVLILTINHQCIVMNHSKLGTDQCTFFLHVTFHIASVIWLSKINVSQHLYPYYTSRLSLYYHFSYPNFLHYYVYAKSHNRSCSDTFWHLTMPSSGSQSTVIPNVWLSLHILVHKSRLIKWYCRTRRTVRVSLRL